MKLYGGYIKPGTIRKAYRKSVVFVAESVICAAVIFGVMALGGLLCWVAGVG